MAAVVWTDFGVVTDPPGALDVVLRHLAPAAWEDAHVRTARDEISPEQALIETIATVQVDGSEIAEATRTRTSTSPAFLELHDWAHWHGWFPVVIGLAPDIVMNTVLDSAGLDRVARHGGRLRFTYQWRLSFLSPRGIEVEEGFRAGFMEAFQRAGDTVVYVGGDPADAATARMADVIFARDDLYAALAGQHERVFRFDSLNDVREHLEREGEAWRVALAKPGGLP